MLFSFIIRTFIIKMIGVEYLGLNGLFTSLLSVLSISALRFSSAMVYSMHIIIYNKVKIKWIEELSLAMYLYYSFIRIILLNHLLMYNIYLYFVMIVIYSIILIVIINCFTERMKPAKA